MLKAMGLSLSLALLGIVPVVLHSLSNSIVDSSLVIDLLAILQKSLDRAIFLYIFIHVVRVSDVRASIGIVHIRKFYEK